MTDKAQTRTVAVGLVTLLHAAVIALLLWRTMSGGAPEGHAGIQHNGLITVSLLPEDHGTAASRPRSAQASQSVRRAPVGQGAVVQGMATSASGTSDRPSTTAQAAEAVTIAPNQTSAMSDDAVLLYRSALQAHLAQYRRYPQEARRDHVEGTVYLHFIVERDGRVLDAWVEESSGSASLDGEALDSVRRAQPLPAIPLGWPPQLDVMLPIAFSLG